MSLTASFYSALSGLDTNSTALQVISDNIANLNTAGFKGSSVQFEDVPVARDDGSLYTVRLKASPVFDERGTVAGFIEVVEDITAEARYNHERETTLKLLRLLNDPNNSHELIHSLTGFFQQWTGCEAVGVRLRDGEDFPYFETRGFPAEFVALENQLCLRDADGRVVRDSCGDPVLECMCGNILCGRFNPALPFFTPKGSFWTNCTTELLASTSEADRQGRTPQPLQQPRVRIRGLDRLASRRRNGRPAATQRSGAGPLYSRDDHFLGERRRSDRDGAGAAPKSGRPAGQRGALSLPVREHAQRIRVLPNVV